MNTTNGNIEIDKDIINKRQVKLMRQDDKLITYINNIN